MRPLPTPPAPGKPVSATLIRKLIDAIRERTVLPGLNTSVKRGPNGTVVNVDVTVTAASSPPAQLHPWKVFGLKQADGEVDVFKIFTPGGNLFRGKITVGGRFVDVDGISMRDVDGENGDYSSFDGEGDISDDGATLYIVIYLTPDENGSSEPPDDDEPQDFMFAAEMVLDPEKFKKESKVKAVYEIIPVATVRVERDVDNIKKGVVLSQRLNTDVFRFTEFYL